MVAGPVFYTKNSRFLNHFQILDLLSLQGATIGGFGLKRPFLCNGANFAYKKAVFLELNGFNGNSNIASGDDIFLLEKIASTYPKQLLYLKNKQAIVSTKAQTSWHALIQQHIRWAAKTSNYNNRFGILTGLTVFFMNALIVLGLALGLFGVIEFKLWFFLLLFKLIIDFALIYKSAVFFKHKITLKHFLPAALLYPFFSVYIALASLFCSYQWKGRRFKK